MEVDVSLIKDRLKKASLLIDALHITGGECTLQPEGLKQVCRLARELGMAIGINTNGSRPEVLKEIVDEGLVDYVALDVKAPLNAEAYSKLTGVDGAWAIERVRRSLDLCRAKALALEVRTTVIPNLLNEQDVASIASSIKDCDLYVLNQFIPREDVLNSEFRKLKATSRELLLKLAQVARENGLREVYIRTLEKGFEKI